MAVTHEYSATLQWSGSTGLGYDNYKREHTVSALPAQTALTLSSDAAFRGDPLLLSPEQLIVLAAMSCQLLSFLAVASRARLDVIGYTDDAHAEMPEDVKPIAIQRIVLRPTIQVRAGATEERLHHLVRVAHNECYIANSLKTEVVVEPVFEIL